MPVLGWPWAQRRCQGWVSGFGFRVLGLEFRAGPGPKANGLGLAVGSRACGEGTCATASCLEKATRSWNIVSCGSTSFGPYSLASCNSRVHAECIRLVSVVRPREGAQRRACALMWVRGCAHWIFSHGSAPRMDPPSGTHVRELSHPCESLLTRGVSADMEYQERVDTRREFPTHSTAEDPARCPNPCPLESPSYARPGSEHLRPMIFFGSKSAHT